MVSAMVALNVLLYAFLVLTAYLSINHHEPLRKYGLTTLAAILAPHPLRWAVGAAVLGVASLAALWRVARVPSR